MNIELNEQESDLLTRVIEGYYSSLREEIYKTETYQLKRELKEEEAMIKSLLEKLRAS
jgi:hypothetical protein